MDFWIGLVCVGLVLLLANLFVNNKYKFILRDVYVIILWVVGSFRYMIGADYYTYVYEYLNWSENNLDIDGMEPTYHLINYILHSLGFDYQMLFLVYESIIIFFTYLGIKYYFEKNKQLLAWFFYSITISAYMYSFNNIRAAAAYSIVFFAYKYFINNETKKLIFMLMIAALFHYSALFFVLVFLLPRKKEISFITWISLLIFSFIIGVLKLPVIVMNYLISSFTKYSEGYSILMVNDPGIWSFSNTLIFLVFVYFLTLILFKNNENKIIRYLAMLSQIYILVAIATNITFVNGTVTDVMSRIKLIFALFNFATMVGLLYRIKYKLGYCLAILFLIGNMSLYFYTIANTKTSASANLAVGNMNYEFNFKLIDE